MTDPINRPAHYTRLSPEPIDVIESWGLGFHLANVVKYVARAGHKGNELEDLRKARWYLDRAIEVREGLAAMAARITPVDASVDRIETSLAELRDAEVIEHPRYSATSAVDASVVHRDLKRLEEPRLARDWLAQVEAKEGES